MRWSNRARSTIERVCAPSPIFSASSHASTLKTSWRLSISTSSARARTVIPTGVAARCLMFMATPTVVCPSGNSSPVAAKAAFSMSAIMAGGGKARDESTAPARGGVLGGDEPGGFGESPTFSILWRVRQQFCVVRQLRAQPYAGGVMPRDSISAVSEIRRRRASSAKCCIRCAFIVSTCCV